MPTRHATAIKTDGCGHESWDSLADTYEAVRSQSVELSRPLSPEDCVVQSMPDASPVKWHLAHTTWFFETFILQPHADRYQNFHPAYSYLFNSYYNAVGQRHARPKRGLLTRPTLREVIEYREYVDAAMAWLFRVASDRMRQELLPLVTLGLNHEQQHQELILSDVKHLFFQNPLWPAYESGRTKVGEQGGSAARWVSFPGGLVEIGHRGADFSFDNEQPRHTTYLQPYRLGNRLITNGEYLEFMEAGGYSRPELWLSAGWDMVQSEGWTAPLYWIHEEGQWTRFTLHGIEPLRRQDPVCHVSYYEADAFARFRDARLPTETEWEAATSKLAIAGNLLESRSFDPAPAPAAAALEQMFGDTWEWTQSAYLAYPGYRPATGALGEYNGKFMCNQMVLRGGSCFTPSSHIRPSYRNFFPPNARWQCTGIRLACED